MLLQPCHGFSAGFAAALMKNQVQDAAAFAGLVVVERVFVQVNRQTAVGAVAQFGFLGQLGVGLTHQQGRHGFDVSGFKSHAAVPPT